MADSTTHLDVPTTFDNGVLETLNAILDALSPAATFGRHGSLCVGFTFAIFGGKHLSGGEPVPIANQTFDLTAFASDTVYLYAEADGTVLVTASIPADWPGPLADGATALYTIVVGVSTITSYTDHRAGGGGISASGILTALEAIYDGTNITLTMSDGKVLLLGPFETP